MAKDTWNVDTTHSEIGFSVKHLVIATVRGQFKTWSGSVAVDGVNFETAEVTAKIDVNSVDTRDEKRDGHLKSPDFFDTANHPEMTFKSASIKKVDDTHYQVTGPLTLRGVTKDVTFEAEFLGQIKDPWGNQRVAFHAHGTVDRTQFGVTFNQVLELGGVAVGEKVKFEIEAQLVKA